MAVSCTIFTHDNSYNRSVLGENAYYFSTVSLLKEYFRGLGKLGQKKDEKIKENLIKIKENYSWEIICDQYAEIFGEATKKGHQSDD